MAQRLIDERARLRLRAHSVFHSALQAGRVAKPKHCQDCGAKPRAFLLRAHHPDHAAPLDVEWLCSRCHGKRNFEAHLSRLFTADEWTRLVAKAKREGVSLRSLILGWCKEWVDD
jgi:hypothetical protein